MVVGGCTNRQAPGLLRPIIPRGGRKIMTCHYGARRFQEAMGATTFFVFVLSDPPNDDEEPNATRSLLVLLFGMLFSLRKRNVLDTHHFAKFQSDYSLDPPPVYRSH